MKILAFSGSNSVLSINQELVKYIIQYLQIPSDIIDLRDYEIPMFGIDSERENGIPNELKAFYSTFKSYDAYIISIPEHNGNYPAFFKNIIDWLTRIDPVFFKAKPLLLLNASPGSNGGKSVLSIAEKSFPFFDGNVIATFSLPQFGSFITDKKINIERTEIITELKNAIEKFEHSLKFGYIKAQKNKC